MAYSQKGRDVEPPYTGGPTPGREPLLTPRDFEMLDKSSFTPPATIPTGRTNNYSRVEAPCSSIQLARQRLRRSLEETTDVNTGDTVMASRSWFQARTSGSESVILTNIKLR